MNIDLGFWFQWRPWRLVKFDPSRPASHRTWALPSLRCRRSGSNCSCTTRVGRARLRCCYQRATKSPDYPSYLKTMDVFWWRIGAMNPQTFRSLEPWLYLWKNCNIPLCWCKLTPPCRSQSLLKFDTFHFLSRQRTQVWKTKNFSWNYFSPNVSWRKRKFRSNINKVNCSREIQCGNLSACLHLGVKTRLRPGRVTFGSWK